MSNTISGPDIERWVVYSTFDAEGRYADYCAEQLQAYRGLAFQIVVVDTSPKLAPEREACWQSFATHWLRRENVGYDFGSYRAGLHYLTRQLGLQATQLAVVFANDSCYGPYAPIGAFIEQFDRQPGGDRKVFGMTESSYYFLHLQSYWLYFRPEVTPLIAEFFEAEPSIVDRETAVRHGELGLSKFLVEHGCRLVVPYSSEALVRRLSGTGFKRLVTLLELGARRLVRRPKYSRIGDAACIRSFLGMYYAFNPTAAYGVYMHVLGLTPFIKRQLLRENPNADPLVPSLGAEALARNDSVYAGIRGTRLFRKRFGAVVASRAYLSPSAAARTGRGIAIVIVTRNALSGLQVTLDSIASLGDPRVTVIVVDGASTDGTPSWLASRAGADTAVTWISEPDQGIYDAMNKGWRMVPTDCYALYLGAGDKILSLPSPDTIQAARHRGSQILIGHCSIGSSPFESRWTHDLYWGNTAHHQALLIHKSLHPSDPFDKTLKVYGDWDFNARLFHAGERATHADDFRSYAAPGGVSSIIGLSEMVRVSLRHGGLRMAARAWRRGRRERKRQLEALNHS